MHREAVENKTYYGSHFTARVDFWHFTEHLAHGIYVNKGVENFWLLILKLTTVILLQHLLKFSFTPKKNREFKLCKLNFLLTP